MDARLNNRPRMFRAAAVAMVGFAMACGLLILFGGLASPVVAAPLADTVISSDITGDTTWTPAGSPYVISGTVSFYSGTLTISPNVTVRFNPSSELVIQTSGRLVAIGTSSQPITFTSNVTPTPASCNWDAIRFTSDNNILRYSLLEYAIWGIDVSETSSGNDISYNTFRNNGLCVTSPVGGAIVGSPDDTTVISNTFTNNASVFYVAKASGNILAYNVVSGTTQPAIAFVRSGSTLSSDNRFYENTIRYAQDVALFLEWGIGNVITNNTIYSNYGAGVRLVTQDSANVLNNTIYGNAFTTTTGSGGVGHNEAGIVVEGKYLNGSTRVEDNAIYANGASGVSSYRAGLYVTGTQSVRVTNNFIHDGIVNYGLDYGLNNTGSPVITGNAVCRDPSFELRSQQAGTLTAEGNWWGTNTPASEISGVVDYTPPIQLVLTPTTGAIPANGTSTTVITVAFNDGGGNLVPAALRTLTLTASAGTLTPTVVTVNSAGTATTSLRSTITPTVATVTATEWCGFAATTTVTFQVVDLSVSKAASLPPYGPGNLITYTISYRNNGNATANGVVLTETVPLSTTFTGSPSGWITAGVNYTRSVGSLAPSASGSITFVVRITDTLPPGDALFTNVVQIGDNGALGADYTPADNVYTLTISGGNLPDLWAVKNDNVGAGSLGGAMVGALANTAGGPGILQMIHALDDIGAQQVPEGGLITYTIGYGNSSQGSANATGVVLSDTLPLYTTYAGPACGQPGGWCQIGATRNYTYPIGALNRGQGDYVYFTVRITNTLPSTVSEVVNTVCIDGAQNDLVPSNDCSSEQTEVISGTYDLSVTKVENATCLNPGDAFGYVITVRNQGTNNATNVILRETLPTNTTYIGLPGPAWTDIGGGVYTYSLGVVASGAITTTQFWVQINAAPPPSVTSITNVVSVQASGTDSNPANDSFTLATPLGTTPDLVITKNDNTSGEIAPGGLITYTIVAVNASNRYTATNVVITETLPAGTVVTSTATSSWKRVGATNFYTYSVETIGLSGMPAVPDFIVQVSNPFTAGSEVVNQVQIRGAESECDLADNTATEETPVQGANYADLAVTKDDDVPLCAVPGDVIAYTISYTNNSYTIPAANVVLTETIDPVAVTFLGPVGWSGGGTTYTRAATPSLATRASGTSIFSVQIAPTIPSGQDRITNVVRIGTTSTDWDLANNVFTLTTSVPLWPDLIVVKNDNIGSLGASAQEELDDILSRLQFSPQASALLQAGVLDGGQVGAMAESVNPGDLITYTVILGNIGRASANSVVTETLPAGTTFVGPGYWQRVGSSNLYTYSLTLGAGIGDVLQFIVRVNNPFAAGSRVINTVQIGSSAQECDTANNTSTEETTVTGAANRYYLPIILKNYSVVPPTPTPTPRPPTPTPTPGPPPAGCAPEFIANIGVGDTPRGLALDPTRSRAYVANYGSSSVSVINSISNTVIQTIASITAANGVAYDPQRNFVWVSNYFDDQVTPIEVNPDATTFTVRSRVNVGDGPWGVAYNSANGNVYVVNHDGNSVTVINASSRAVITTVTGFDQPYHVAVNPATNKVYVTNFGNHSVAVINGATNTVSHVVNLNTGDPGTQPYGIAVDELRDLVYVATVNSHRIVTIGWVGGVPIILNWAELHRGYDPGRPALLRIIAANPDMGPYGDGGHLWTTTSQADGSEKDQVLLIPKGSWGGFHRPIPYDLTANPSEGIAVNRLTDRVYVTVGGTPGQVLVLGDNANPCAIAFEVGDEIGIEVFTAP